MSEYTQRFSHRKKNTHFAHFPIGRSARIPSDIDLTVRSVDITAGAPYNHAALLPMAETDLQQAGWRYFHELGTGGNYKPDMKTLPTLEDARMWVDERTQNCLWAIQKHSIPFPSCDNTKIMSIYDGHGSGSVAVSISWYPRDGHLSAIRIKHTIGRIPEHDRSHLSSEQKPLQNVSFPVPVRTKISLSLDSANLTTFMKNHYSLFTPSLRHKSLKPYYYAEIEPAVDNEKHLIGKSYLVCANGAGVEHGYVKLTEEHLQELIGKSHLQISGPTDGSLTRIIYAREGYSEAIKVEIPATIPNEETLRQRILAYAPFTEGSMTQVPNPIRFALNTTS